MLEARDTFIERKRRKTTKVALPRVRELVGRSLLIVRCHMPTVAAMKRILSWEADLRGSCYDLVLSIDVTNGGTHKQNVEKTLLTNSSNIEVHSYTSAEMLTEFPALRQAMQRMPPMWTQWATGGKDSCKPSLAWGFHIEAICLYTSKRSCRQAPCDVYDFVWVLEDDVGFTGNILNLLSAYQDNKADLITESCWPSKRWDPFGAVQSQGSEEGWCWHDTGSDSFLHAVSDHERFHTREHVQRFSTRYLRHLNSLSRHGMLAWSELSSITLCKHEPSLKCTFFDPCHIGFPYSFDRRLSERAFRCKSRDPPSHNRLFHSLKF
jgi:hypothetical protein